MYEKLEKKREGKKFVMFTLERLREHQRLREERKKAAETIQRITGDKTVQEKEFYRQIELTDERIVRTNQEKSLKEGHLALEVTFIL